MSLVFSRRVLLGAPLVLAARPGLARTRSYAAAHGAAPFTTAHLIPGDTLDLAKVDLSIPAARVIALTIDDGPDPHEIRMLEVLRQHGARATFFWIGRRIPEHRDAALQVAASGNEVGNHSQDHPMMTDLPPAEMIRNLDAANAALARVGVRPAWFRPPFGDVDGAVAGAARARGMRTTLWTVDTRDWKGVDADTVARRATDHLAPGAVILMHGTKAATETALPRILDEGARQGYRFVTMTEWYETMERAMPPVGIAGQGHRKA